jgi:hypothetical protein
LEKLWLAEVTSGTRGTDGKNFCGPVVALFLVPFGVFRVFRMAIAWF